MTEKVYNWGVAGHQKQLSVLAKDLNGGSLPHAYLFAGPLHIGKYTLAKRLTKVLQCDSLGCDTCQVCLNISRGYHSETIEVNDDGETIKIEPMRVILSKLATTTPGKYKILLVKNIERMTPEAANALLKTLEEPPSQVLFLFTASRAEDVLPTILSRVRTLKFKNLLPAEVLEFLREKYPLEAPEKLQEVTDLSFGLPGRAVRFMEQEETFTQVKALFERVRNVLAGGDVTDKFSLVAEVTQDEEMFGEFFDIFLLALRYTMHDAAEQGCSSEKLRRTIAAVRQTQEALRLQKRNVNARLLFEHLMLQT